MINQIGLSSCLVIQISVPVLFEGKPIGALVVEIDGSRLEALA